MLEAIIYVGSLAFQLSAGILLLIGNTSTKKEKIIQKYCERYRPIFVDREGTLRNYEEFKSVVKVTWINKFAFLYLIIGYLVSVFGECPGKKGIAFGIVIILCTIFTAIAYLVSKAKTKKYGTVNFNDYILSEGVMVIEQQDV